MKLALLNLEHRDILEVDQAFKNAAELGHWPL